MTQSMVILHFIWLLLVVIYFDFTKFFPSQTKINFDFTNFLYYSGHLQVIKALISKCDADPEEPAIDTSGDDVDFMNPYSNGDHSGETPLHLATAMGHTEVVKFLASKCKNPMSKAGDLQVTSLHIASQKGDIEIIKVLKRYMYLMDESIWHDGAGETPIHVATRGTFCIL